MKTYKFRLGDMLPGENFYFVGDFFESIISEHDYPKGKRLDRETGRILVFRNHKSFSQYRHEYYHVNAEVIPANFARVYGRKMARKRREKLKQRENSI